VKTSETQENGADNRAHHKIKVPDQTGLYRDLKHEIIMRMGNVNYYVKPSKY
jgi:hypothetical protein